MNDPPQNDMFFSFPTLLTAATMMLSTLALNRRDSSASERASWVSGAVVPVDGGFLHRENWF